MSSSSATMQSVSHQSFDQSQSYLFVLSERKRAPLAWQGDQAKYAMRGRPWGLAKVIICIQD